MDAIEIDTNKHYAAIDRLCRIEESAHELAYISITTPNSKSYIWKAYNFMDALNNPPITVKAPMLMALASGADDASEIIREVSFCCSYPTLEMEQAWKDGDLAEVGRLYQRILYEENGINQSGGDHHELGRLLVQRLIDYMHPIAEKRIELELMEE